MTLKRRIENLNSQAASLKKECYEELEELLDKANSLMTTKMKREAAYRVEEEGYGGYLIVSYDDLSLDCYSSDYYTIANRLAYDSTGELVVCSGVTSDYDPDETTLNSAIGDADTWDIIDIYNLFEHIIEEHSKGKIVYEG